MLKIVSITARPVLYSRGEWTVEVTVTLEDGTVAWASVPQGKSKGSHEAAYVKPEDAVGHVRSEINNALRGMDPREQEAIDTTMIKLDGTANKERLGANALLGVSLACARAAAKGERVPLWQYLARLAGTSPHPDTAPRLCINMIEGGLHAGSSLMFQEHLLIPHTRRVSEAIEIGMKAYQALRMRLSEKYGPTAVNVSDEGGFTPDTTDVLNLFSLLYSTVNHLGLAISVDFGLDAAAENITQEAGALLPLYRELKEKHPIITYIEDPFGEEDFDSFAMLLGELGGDTLIVGDDLTTTNIDRATIARKKKSINAIIVKPSQIGTLTETLTLVKQVREWDWKVFVSHRGGETNDAFIADLAYGIDAEGIKLGAPARGERIAKYNRFLEIEREAQ